MSTAITAHRASRLLAVLAVASLFAGACSSDGDDAKKDETTTTVAAADGTTTEPEAETTTTEATKGGGEGEVSSGDLEEILPTAGDLGDGWIVNTKPDDESEGGPDFDELCPDAAEFRGAEDDDEDKVKAKFVDEDTNEEIEVELSPSAETFEDEQLEAYAEALSACTPTYTDEESGLDYAFAFEANTLDDYGDQGLQLEAEVTVAGESLPNELQFTIYGLIYRSGSIGVDISGQDGINQSYEVSEFDPDRLITLADELDPKVEDLAGS